MAFLIASFPVATVLQGISVFDSINRVIMFGLILFLIIGLFSNPIGYREFAVLVSGTAMAVIAIILTGKPMYFNPMIYYPFWILFFVVMARDYKEFIALLTEEEALLRKALIVWEVVVFVSIFFSRSYSYEWNDKYFTSFAGSAHRFASSCLAMMAFVAVLYINTLNKRYIIHFLAINMGMFFCGARTYLVIGFVYVICLFYVSLKKKRIFYYSILPIIGIGILVILLTPIGTKFTIGFEGEGYYGFWATLTSGRSILWSEDLAAYWDLDIIRKLVGNGANFVYQVSMNGVFQRPLYAHNDYINLLCSNGLLGMIVYFWALYNFVNRAKEGQKKAFIPLMGFYTIIYFNAFFNMLYTYPNAVVAVPFIYYSLCGAQQKLSEE